MATLSGQQSQPRNNSEVAEATQVSPVRIVLPPGSTMSIPDGDLGTIRLEGDVTLTAPGIGLSQGAAPAPATVERVDATTIRVDGTMYTRGTARDVARPVDGPQSRTTPEIQAAPPVVEATQIPPQTPTPTPLRVGGGIREPRKIRDVRPLYPQAARDAGISGVVILEAVIDPEGMPANLKVLRSIPDLDQAAINAVRQWRYAPTLLNGVPVAVMMTVTVNFILQQPQGSLPSLEARYATLQREAQELARTPEELEARRRELQQQLATLEQQIAAARATATNVGAAAAPAASLTGGGAGVVRVGDGIAEPKKMRDVRPVYPSVAQASNVSGVVIMEITIDADGNVTNPRILRSIPLLDQAALEAVSQWKYTPTLVNGIATSIIMTVTINFQLG